MADDAGARLDRYLGQIRHFTRRNHEAVFIIGDDLLPSRREMLIVGKQTRPIRIRCHQGRWRSGRRRTQQCPRRRHTARLRAARMRCVGELETECRRERRYCTPHRIAVRRDEIDTRRVEIRPERLGVKQPIRLRRRVTKRIIQPAHDNKLRAGGMQLRNRSREAACRSGEIGGLIDRERTRAGISGGERNIVGAGADQIERAVVRVPAIAREIIADLRRNRNRSGESAIARAIGVNGLGTARRKIGAALIRRSGRQTEQRSERLGTHQPRAGGRLSCARRDGSGPLCVAESAATRIRERAIESAINRAVTKDDKLIKLLRSNRTGRCKAEQQGRTHLCSCHDAHADPRLKIFLVHRLAKAMRSRPTSRGTNARSLAVSLQNFTEG